MNRRVIIRLFAVLAFVISVQVHGAADEVQKKEFTEDQIKQFEELSEILPADKYEKIKGEALVGPIMNHQQTLRTKALKYLNNLADAEQLRGVPGYEETAAELDDANKDIAFWFAIHGYNVPMYNDRTLNEIVKGYKTWYDFKGYEEWLKSNDKGIGNR